MNLLSCRALGGDGGGALEQHARGLDAVGDGAALVVDRTAGGAASLGGLFQGSVVELRADQRFTRRIDQERGRCDGAKADARGGADAILDGEADAKADD